MKRVLLVSVVCWAAACLPPPSVSLRLRARVQRTQTRSAQALEARVDCGWSLEPRATAARRPLHELERPAASERAPEIEPLPCAQPSTCRWETEQRELALAAFMFPTLPDSGGAP